MRKFIEIDQAWKILGHEETKKEYDLLRLGGCLWGGASTHCSPPGSGARHRGAAPSSLLPASLFVIMTCP